MIITEIEKKIKYLIIFLFVAMLIIIPYFLFKNKNKQIDKRFLGKWENIFITKNKKFRIVSYFSQDTLKNNLTLKLSIPKFYVINLFPDELNIEGDSVSFSINRLRLVYRGKIFTDSSMIKGILSLGKLTQKFNFLREKQFIKSIRPQYPLKPYPYTEEEIKIRSSVDSAIIAGTLTHPKDKGKFPTIILASGMGPQDRDETMYGHKPFLVIADYFTKHGFAVLRIDDRGMGGSSGNYFTANTNIFAKDLIDCFNYLKKLKYIDSTKIGIIGFNEGGIVGAIAASKQTDIAFLVLLSTPGLPAKQILLDQTKIMQKLLGKSSKEINYDYYIDKKIYTVLETVDDSSSAVKKLEKIYHNFKEMLPKPMSENWKYSDKVFKKKLKFFMSPWFRYYIKINPTQIFAQVNCPTLVLFGSKDIQILPKKNLLAIENAFRINGNKNIKGKIYKNLNHLFQNCKTGLPNEYSKIEETISPDVLKDIEKWLENKIMKKND